MEKLIDQDEDKGIAYQLSPWAKQTQFGEN